MNAALIVELTTILLTYVGEVRRNDDFEVRSFEVSCDTVEALTQWNDGDPGCWILNTYYTWGKYDDPARSPGAWLLAYIN
jgi:hypothetical protein